jgi:Raf kinase inhibitor-like YbhB/YbcL family protein
MKLESSAFQNNQPIPRRNTEDGVNISPPLNWTGAPAGTGEFALICDDPDAPTEKPWVHWLIYGIPGDITGLPEGQPRKDPLDSPKGSRQGENSFKRDRIGYRGPAPPPGHGTHHYHFRLYALDNRLNLGGGVQKETLLAAMEGHVLETAELIGTYQR